MRYFWSNLNILLCFSNAKESKKIQKIIIKNKKDEKIYNMPYDIIKIFPTLNLKS
jgi:hypothetical protein